MKRYYEAYDERYKTIHAKGYSWASHESTPIVADTIRKYNIEVSAPMLEIGCGEGRDAKPLLEKGFNLLATDVSPEAISYCKNEFPLFENSFRVLDCLTCKDDKQYAFIYSVAVIHMLILDEDRNGFYRYIYKHLSPDGIALICTMGDGQFEKKSDINDAFVLKERDHPSGKVKVAGTSCRMVSFKTFERELAENNLQIMVEGITSCMPEFDSLMYAVVRQM